jgi:hypothetical protein
MQAELIKLPYRSIVLCGDFMLLSVRGNVRMFTVCKFPKFAILPYDLRISCAVLQPLHTFIINAHGSTKVSGDSELLWYVTEYGKLPSYIVSDLFFSHMQ